MKHIFYLMALFLAFSLQSYAEDEEESTGTQARWDWIGNTPTDIHTNTSFESGTGWLKSSASTTAELTSLVFSSEGNTNFADYQMYVDASSGKLSSNGSGNGAQFNQGTKLYVPVFTKGDRVTVEPYTSYAACTVGGLTVVDGGTTYTASTADITNGYVVVEATGNGYLYSIQWDAYNPFQEKCIYSTDFTEWNPVDRATTNTVVDKKTKYSSEQFTFTFDGVGVDPEGSNNKFEYIGYMVTAKNSECSSENVSAVTSPISSITKIVLTQAATGGNRGIKVSVKGDEDSDWVVLHKDYIATQKGETLDLDVNRTNCAIKFESLAADQNAYVVDLNIYGEIDFSAIPSLDCFTINGTTYYGDVFDEDADGNMVTTVELFSTETMVSSNNPITNITGEGSSTVGTVTYTDGDDACTVTIPVTLDSKTVNFIIYVVRKPWYTLTYYNSDGTALAQTQSIEKDTKIGSFIYTETDVTVATGKKFRGWAEAQKESRKYTTDDIVTSDLSLYALVTDIEVESRSARYTYSLTNDYFDADDHEAFNPSDDGYYHDGTHGWAFNSSGSIDILVGGNAFIIMSLCSYSAEGTISLVDAKGNSVCSDISVKADTDGALGTFQYEGEAGALTIKFSASGSVYLHKLTIANTADLDIDADGEYIVVPVVENQTDVERGNTLLSVIDIANAQATENGRVFVFLPNGTYDLGEECLTQISRSNVSLIGQSETKTTIMNAAPVEGIAVSATLLNTSTGLYMQDLTLKNAYDYYGLAGDGRADCFQDNGSHTIMKNIRMLSYQDTYYSYNNNDHYFETSEIHGIVDYICGSGNVFFHECTLYNEGRGGDNVAGSSSQYCYITAPNTAQSCQFGYVFDSCTVTGTPGQTYCYGRSWNYYPRCVWINTTLADPSCIIAERWRLEGMNNCVPDVFAEYGTVDASGNASMPTTTTQTFFGVEKSIVLTAEEAATYSYESFSTASEWDPMAEAEQIELEGLTFTGNVVSWTGNDDAKCYGVFINSIFQDFTKETSYTLPEGVDPETDHICVRAANKNGGLGPNLENFPEPSSIATVSNDAAELVGVAYYDLSGRKLVAPQRGINIAIEYYSDGTQKSTKVLTK